jgi:hypothetical protein
VTIFGWDSSHFDAVPDTERAIAEGFLFFSHKAGGDANDAELAAWWAGAKRYRDRALLGAYWVLYPGSPTSRADAFVKRLDDQCPGWRDGPFILQVDCEKWNNDSGTVPSKADIKTFCDRLVAKMPKLRPIVYGPSWVYGNTLAGLGYPLWASSYVNGVGAASALYPGDGSGKWSPYSGQTPAILQFSSSATIAGQTTCDANAYRGTLAELTNLVAPGWEIDMDLTDENLRDIAKATWNSDNIIEAPAGSKNADGSDNLYLAPKTFIKDMNNRLTKLSAAVAALGTASVDVDALATALEPKINGMTRDQVKAALVEVFEEGTGGTV